MRRRVRATPVKEQVSSQFSPGEISSIIIAWLVLSVAITYRNFVGLFTGMGSIEVVIAGFIATATGFIIHEMGHKYVAIRRGYVAHFRLWMQGLLLTLFVVVFQEEGSSSALLEQCTLRPRQWRTTATIPQLDLAIRSRRTW